MISGGSGFVGSELIPLLVDEGHTVLVLSRAPEAAPPHEAACRVVSYQGWEAEGAGYDLFVNLAVLNSPESSQHQRSENVNCELAEQLATQARKASISRFFYCSSVHALDFRNHGSFAASKRMGEQRARISFGEGFHSSYWGSVHGKKFSGRLEVLNRLPQWLQKPAFSLMSALIPTTAVGSILSTLESEVPGGRSFLTDDKDENWVYRLWRHSINLLFAVGAGALFPILSLIWLAIILGDGRPGIFLQDRVGKGGVIFSCVKLRTMINGTASDGTHLVGTYAVTRLGRLLRRMKIDEIPQAWNVLKGEMNLIGQRPSLTNQSEVISQRQLAGVGGFTPGVTGWAQVSGVDMSDPERLARLDAEYSSLRSIIWDLKIIKRTLVRGND